MNISNRDSNLDITDEVRETKKKKTELDKLFNDGAVPDNHRR
jgi:hypothetical protein